MINLPADEPLIVHRQEVGDRTEGSDGVMPSAISPRCEVRTLCARMARDSSSSRIEREPSPHCRLDRDRPLRRRLEPADHGLRRISRGCRVPKRMKDSERGRPVVTMTSYTAECCGHSRGAARLRKLSGWRRPTVTAYLRSTNTSDRQRADPIQDKTSRLVAHSSNSSSWPAGAMHCRPQGSPSGPSKMGTVMQGQPR